MITPRLPKRSKTLPSSPGDLAEQFRQLQDLRKAVRELEELEAPVTQPGAVDDGAKRTIK